MLSDNVQPHTPCECYVCGPLSACICCAFSAVDHLSDLEGMWRAATGECNVVVCLFVTWLFVVCDVVVCLLAISLTLHHTHM